MKKRFVILLLAVSMILSLGISAFAEELPELLIEEPNIVQDNTDGIIVPSGRQAYTDMPTDLGVEESNSFLSDSNEEPTYVSVTGSYYDDGNINTGFIYSDKMLLQSSYEMSGDIAKFAVTLSAAAYSENGSNVRKMLESDDMGYTVGCFDYTYPRTLDDNDVVAYVIGRKVLDDGKQLYCVVIRGTNGLEWCSNFNMGDPETNGGNHLGFHLAARRVKDVLTNLFSNDGAIPSDRYILFTGHSRGAAVANILAAQYSLSEDIPADHVFGYTFACPAVSKNARESGFENIFNFNNYGDAIPAVPLASWGYKRFGIDYKFAFSMIPAFTMQYYNTFKNENASITDTVGYEFAVETLFPKETTVNEPKGRFAAMVLAWKLSKTNEVSFGDLVAHYGKGVFKDTSLYEQAININDISSEYSALYNEHKEFDEYEKFLKEADQYWKSQTDYTQEDFYQWRREHRDEIEKIQEITGMAITAAEDFPTALGIILKLAPVAWDAGTLLGCILDITNSSAGGAMDAITDGHRTRTYVMGINTQYFGCCAYLENKDITRVDIPICVKTIGNGCFDGSSVTVVSGLDHVEYIGNSAFYGAKNLSSVKFGKLKTIQSGVFCDCSNLKEIILDGVEVIEVSAFSFCSGLETLYIPDSIRELEVQEVQHHAHPGYGEYIGPFSNCTSLKNISVGGIKVIKEGMLRTDSSVLERLTIRGTVKTIDERAFISGGYVDTNNHYDVVTDHPVELIIEEGVEEIGWEAFFGCTIFTSVSIPDSVTSIGNMAFNECERLTDVSIGSGAIGNFAFQDCSSLTSVTIGNGVTSIGYAAFENCSSLTSVTIPESVTSIGNRAFYGCSSRLYYTGTRDQWSQISVGENNYELTQTLICLGTQKSGVLGDLHWTLSDCTLRVTGTGRMPTYSSTDECPWRSCCKDIVFAILESGVSNIGGEAFSGCNNLASVTIPDSVTNIGNSAFSGCSNLTSVTIPDSVTNIGNSAFSGCSNLTSVTIGNSVTSIGNSAFYGCSNLTSVTIGTSVTSIGTFAFNHCCSLTSVTIPDSVTSIGDWAFDDCSSLTSVTIGNSVTIGTSVTSIGYAAFENCSNLTSVTIGTSVTSIGYAAFENCSSLTSVMIGSVEAWCKINFSDSYSNPLHYARKLYLNGELITDLIIPDSVTRIGNYAFYGCSNLTSVTIPESVTYIGYQAFEDCSSLTSITIPDSVTSIGDRAFSGCSGLTSVTIPESVTSIGNDAFSGCSSLTSVTIPDGVTSIGRWAFNDCNSLMSVTIPDGVTSIGDWAFDDCNSLMSVTIPDSVTSCSSLTGIWVSENNTAYSNDECGVLFDKAKDNLIQAPGMLDAYIVPSSVTSIGERAFSGCRSLTSVTIPESVTSIGNSAFSECSSLTSVTIPASVTSIGGYAFCDCSSLTSVTIPDSVTSIGGYAFCDCSSLTSVTIPDSVTSIGNYAFAYCSSLKFVYYGGTQEQWNAVSIGYKNDALTAALFLYTTPSEQKTIFDLNGWLDGNLPGGNIDGYGVVDIYINDKLVAESVSDYCSDFPIGTKYEIRNIRALDGYHYDGIHSGSLSGIIGPDRVEVFLSFSELTYLNLDGRLDENSNDGLAQYGTADVYINGQLVANACNDYWEAWPTGTTYEIKNIVANPGYHYNGVYSGSLSGTIGTERVNIVLSFGINTSGVCGDSITWRLEDDKLFIEGTGEMYDYFYYPPWYSSRLSIKEVRISDGVTTIGNDTCHYCTNLESVSIPDSITSIGVSAFSECSSLASIKIPENVTRIDDYAFYYCEKLTDIRIPNNVAYIGEWAFIGCTNLKSFTIPDSVSYIGTYAFCGCNSLPSVVIPYFVPSIGEYTFSWCSSMESITIPNSVKSIDHHAFDSCSHLSDVYYMGTEAQWRLIAISADNESLTNATIHYLTEPDFVLPFSLKKIEDEAFEGGVFTFAKLSYNVAMIGSRAFADCPNLKYIYIPAATKTITADAFDGVEGLTILGASGSTAETFATAHGYTFIAIS